MSNNQRIYDRKIPDFGDVMTVEVFRESIKNGLFTTFDGSGYFCKDNKMSRQHEVFSAPPLDATHVCWFNK